MIHTCEQSKSKVHPGPHALFYCRGKSLSPHRYSVSPCLRSFMRCAPFYQGGLSSPDPSSTTPADRPAAPTDRQPLRIPSAAPPITSPTSSAPPRESYFDFDEPPQSGFATPTRVSPTFDLRSARPGDPPFTWSYLQPLTRPPDPPLKLSARRENGLQDRLEMGPEFQPPAGSFQNKSFGRPWGGFHGAPHLKALSSPLAGIAPLCMAFGCIREKPRTPNTNGG
jgi:hypothetical protein